MVCIHEYVFVYTYTLYTYENKYPPTTEAALLKYRITTMNIQGKDRITTIVTNEK